MKEEYKIKMLRPSLLENPESPMRSNPWSPSSTFVDVGSLQRVISLAERTGHLERVSKYFYTAWNR